MTATRSVRMLGITAILAAMATFVLVERAIAAPPSGAVYEGTTSGGGTVRLTIGSDGMTADILVRHATASVGGAGCATEFSTAALKLGTNGAQFTVNEVASSGTTVSMSGFFALPGSEAIAGAFSQVPTSGSCPRHLVTWTADRTPKPAAPTGKPTAGIVYDGPAYTVNGTRIGTASYTQTVSGASSVSITLDVPGCPYLMVIAGATDPPIGTAAHFSMSLVAAGRVSGVLTPTAMGGGFVVEAVSATCPKVAGMWAVLPPRPSGNFVSTPNFGTASTALAVFTGGTVAQLEAAAKNAGASGVWVQDSSGSFALLVVAGPAFINDAFRARFTSGLPTNSAVTLTK